MGCPALALWALLLDLGFIGTPQSPCDRLAALEQEKAQAEMRLRTSKPAPVLRLHTKLPELYRSKVERLAEALNAPDTVTEAAEIMRGLIDRIVLTPEGDVLRAELHGDLAVLARFAQAKEGRAEGDSALRLSVVAGVGFEPTTFRL
jgi:site-specific DNA recombinase